MPDPASLICTVNGKVGTLPARTSSGKACPVTWQVTPFRVGPAEAAPTKYCGKVGATAAGAFSVNGPIS